MPSKKVNPRRVPCTQADLDRVKKEAIDYTFELMITMFCYILVDKRGVKADYLRWLGHRVNDLSESIRKKYVKVEDLQKILREEYDFDWREFS